MLTYHPALWAPLLPEGGEFKILPTFSHSHLRHYRLVVTPNRET